MTEPKKTKTQKKDAMASAHHTVETQPVETPTGEKPSAHYELHLLPANHEQHTTNDSHHVKPHFAKDSFYRNAAAKNARPQSKTSNRIWRFLEWLATSALIFIVLFFTINFSAYFELFKDKLDSLRGTYGLSPYIENMMTDGQSKTQELLPLTATVDQNKKQIPYISVDIAPPDDRIIIPRIGKNIPIVNVKTENLIKRDWNALEKDMQEALQQGVVHYPGTAEPGDHGNVVITGHSSYFLWDPGQFKDVFALLHQVVEGDTIIVYHNQIKYTYKVYQKEVVTPDKVSVLAQEGGDRLTLITCTPVGTNLKRLVVFAKPA
jgi:LPXTG-site transpeptidase (sortase) family protein